MTTFGEWWAERGSAMRPQPGEDHEAHAQRVAAAAWSELLSLWPRHRDDDRGAPDYADEETLRTIREWPLDDVAGWFEFIEQCLPFYGRFSRLDGGRVVEIATGGWSGCEEIIDAMAKNFGLYATTWISAHRGGLHRFQNKELAKGGAGQ